MEEKQKKSIHLNLMLTPEQHKKITDGAKNLSLNKTQYIIRCIENQPALPVFVYASDDLSDIVDALSDIAERFRRLENGIAITGAATARDMEELKKMNDEISSQYQNLVMKYQEQRKNATKTARRMVKDWKKKEQE